MRDRDLVWVLLFTLLAGFAVATTAHADEAADFAEAVTELGSKNRLAVRDAVEKLGATGDPRALPVLEALEGRRLMLDADGRVLILSGDGGNVTDPVDGTTRPAAGLKLKDVRINNVVRRALEPAIARLQLFAPDPRARLAAAEALVRRPLEGAEPNLRKALATETDPEVRETLALAVAQLNLGSQDRDRRLGAIASLGEAGSMRFRSLLAQLLNKNPDGNYVEPDEQIRQAAERAIAAIDARQRWIRQAGNLFYGLSLGSVLLLAALGLAITFGLMGVINMAHGEMLMLGAYTTFVIQGLFRTYWPGLFDAYLLLAIPTAFAVTAMVGMVLERTVIRHLYGRPLETLLATWGISLMLIQTVRLIFGAQNVQVAHPDWLAGGTQLAPGLVLTYNRLAIILFAILVLTVVWVLFQHTRLGLNVRTTIQNRSMAAAIGINTARVDMWTFGLGSGVAGLGGVALSQLGNVGPELGQSYIVDCFMVVVLGGVGKLAGAVAGAMTLGIVNKFLEPMTGAVLGKIMVLIFIILFIQKRPQGLFALKGRTAET